MSGGSESTSGSATLVQAPALDGDRGPAGGSTFGRYVVVDVLGEGAMGRVMRAYDPQLDREVALKLLRSEGDAIAVARIVREAQAMARLSHPNIVAVYDVDTHEGQPFIVMERVEGMTLRAWLTERARSVREIVDAFIAAGRGLAAAHAAGIVHRDFKPTNVLRDKEGRVRVTDFGIARSMHEVVSDDVGSVPRLSDGTLTVAGTVVGTPAYMAPEQHERNATDPKTDQYAFCISLWEGLCGTRPFRGPNLRDAKVLMRIVEPAPERTIAPHLRKILVRGLSPNPDDRHPSMDALLFELARDPSRRRRIIAVAGVCVVGIAAWAGATWLARARAEQACHAEGERLDAVWNDTTRTAIGQRMAATGVAYADDAFQRTAARLDAFAAAWWQARTQACLDANAQPNDTTQALAVECLDQCRADLEALIHVLADADANVVRNAVGSAADLMVPAQCFEPIQLANRATLPEDPDARAEIEAIRRGLSEASALRVMGRFTEAKAVVEPLVARADATGWAPVRTEVAASMGMSANRLGAYAEAEDLLERAYFEAAADGNDQLALSIAVELVHLTGHHRADYDASEGWFNTAIAIADRLGSDEHPEIARAYDSHGTVLLQQGRYDEAESAHEQAIATWTATLGAEHPITIRAVGNLATTHFVRGEHEQALALYRRANAVEEEIFGPDHPELAVSLNNLGNVHFNMGAYDESLAVHERVLAIRLRAFGPEHGDVAQSLNNIGNVHARRGAAREALDAFERSAAMLERTFGPEHPNVAIALNNVAGMLADLGELERAESVTQRALAIGEKAFGLDHPTNALALEHLGQIALERGRPERAIAHFERALAIRERVGARDEALASRFGLAKALWDGGGDRKRAVALVQQCLDDSAGRPELAGGRAGAQAWLDTHRHP